MEITREMVEEALDFYRLDDPGYRKKCFDCVEEIKGNEALSKKIDEVTDAFFVTEHGEKRSLYRKQTVKEIFSEVKSNYIGNVVFFSGCRRHKEGIKRMGFDEFQTEHQIKGVRGSLTFDKDGLGMRYFSWGSVFIRCDIVKAGNLQFERVIHSPSAETVEPPKCTHIHIPRGSDISREAVAKTLKEGKEAVLKYFGPGFEQRY